MDQFAKETIAISLEEEMRKSYLDYAMSVIIGRALPDVRDGLKPVHRRVLYGMHEMNNVWNRPYVKCARVVGEVMGKYHPHGDQSIYDTLVRMAQDFSLRYMLVDGQGNFGSVDGDGAAAMRYTECRLDRITEEMLADIDKETVDFVPNYDGKEREPSVLPTRIPNLLINGSSGIAVGMATNIPPHNLTEVIRGSLYLLENPDCSVDDLIDFVPAPDFPTGAIIYGIAGVREGYRTGRGRVVMRAKTHFEERGKDGSRDRMDIIVDELPYQVNKKELLKKIAEGVRDKKLEGISDIRDESDKSGMRIVFELRRNENPEVVLNNLFKQTQLQDSFGMNILALVDGRPKTLNLKQMLECFISHRREVVTRRTIFELRKARERGHILEGLAVALANIDDFIAIIRAAPTPAAARQELMERSWDSSLVRAMLERAAADHAGTIADFRPEGLPKAFGMQEDSLYRLSEEQASEILQMRLQRLTGLEQEKIREEYASVMASIAELLGILGDPAKVRAIIREELEDIITRYGDKGKDARRSVIEEAGADFETEDLIKPEDMVVTMSREGYIKAQPLSEYRTQKRGGGGKRVSANKEGDSADQIFIANTHDCILSFTNRGRVFWLRVWQIPKGSSNSQGRPAVNMFPLDEGEKISVMLPLSGEYREFPEDHYIITATRSGIVKKTELSAFKNQRKGGIIAVGLDDGDDLIGAAVTDGNATVILFTDENRAVRFSEDEIKATGRGARGVKGIDMKDAEDRVIAMVVCENEDQLLLTATARGYGRLTTVSEYPLYGRGTKGVIAMNVNYVPDSESEGREEVRSKVVAATRVDDKDEIMLMTSAGNVVRIKADGVSRMGRNTKGVRLVNLKEGTELLDARRIPESVIVEGDGTEPLPDDGEAPDAPSANEESV